MKLITAEHQFTVELYDTPTAKAIAKKLPIEGNAILWGKEIYFSIPVNAELDTSAREIMEEGEIAFYPPLNAFCIFFGPTPVSTDSKPRAADLVNVVGKIKGNYTLLEEVRSGEKIQIVY